MTDDFADRVARLKEHLVEPTADDLLAQAEQDFAAGDPFLARMTLAGALRRKRREDLETRRNT